MSRKTPIILILLGSLLLVSLLFWVLPVRQVNAQCKNASGCKACHEVQGVYPVNTSGDWHFDHAYADLCQACHGGVRDATDKDAAHVGIITKYQDMPANCKQCHTADLNSKLDKYTQALNIDPAALQSSLKAAEKASSPVRSMANFLGQAPAGAGAQDIQPTKSAAPLGSSAGPSASASSSKGSTAAAGASAVKPPKSPNTTGNLILGGLLLLGLVGGGGYITWNERRLAQIRGARQRSWLAAQIRKEHWSPYAAGVLLGITCILAVLLAHRTLGASSAIASIASTLGSQAAPETIGKSMYFKFIMPPGFNWEIALLIGVFFGGMLGALSSGTFKLRWNDDPTWKKVFGAQRWKRFVIGFLGAVILQYGAGIAGGCTSGLAISGGMLLAPSAFIFMAGMFISGILVAILVFRRRY